MRQGRDGRARGFALVGLLLVVLIIGLATAVYLGLGRSQSDGNGEDGLATTTPGRAIEKAKSVECANNLRQLRMLIQTEMTVEGEYPRKLNADSGGALTHCPVSGKAYVYDPRTGRVSCPTPGHETL